MAKHEKAEFERILRVNREKEAQDQQLAQQVRPQLAGLHLGRTLSCITHSAQKQMHSWTMLCGQESESRPMLDGRMTDSPDHQCSTMVLDGMVVELHMIIFALPSIQVLDVDGA
jgi:hypothetical protein